ncbi:MAG: hypothetical protein AAB373_01465 [Patescibacteria group bacterium]
MVEIDEGSGSWLEYSTLNSNVKSRISATVQMKASAAAAMDMWAILNKAGTESTDTIRGSLDISLDSKALNDSDIALLRKLNECGVIQLVNNDSSISGFEIDLDANRSSRDVVADASPHATGALESNENVDLMVADMRVAVADNARNNAKLLRMFGEE